METLYASGTPLAAYLEGEGSYEPPPDDFEQTETPRQEYGREPFSFAPPNILPRNRLRPNILPPIHTASTPSTPTSITRFHNAWSTAVNSRLGRADNAKFLEHFRYILVASQLLNEYLDQGALQPATTSTSLGSDGVADTPSLLQGDNSLFGAAAAATVAFALVYLIHWARSGRGGHVSKSRVTLVLVVFAVVTLFGYAYLRRQWLKYLRQQAVDAASGLTSNWQAFEVSSSSALQFIQEVELVSKGYRLSTPLPPASRIEDSGPARRCARLRKNLYKAYAASIPAAIAGITTLRTLIDADDLDRYYDVYDINPADVAEATSPEALTVLEDDPESLKSLRVLSYRAAILRRTTCCALMSLDADGSKPDFARWHTATEAMQSLRSTVGSSAETLRATLASMETLNIPTSPGTTRTALQTHSPNREKMRGQVRKISALSSGIRGLQAKMQILREETSRSIETSSEDLTDIGPSLMAQYDSIGADLKDLMQAWETGKASLQSNIHKQEKRLSLASSTASGLRSPVSSLGGLTAVDEDGSPEDALRALTGKGADSHSNRSSLATTPSEEGEAVFEAIAMPKQRSSLTREERIVKMQEERQRRTSLMARREVGTNMMRELESVISLRPKKTANGNGLRVTSV